MIADLFHLYLHFSLDSVLLSYLFLSDGYHILTQFISLLKINNELVLSSNDLLVLFNLFLEHHDFFELGVSHFAQEIVQGSDFNVKFGDLVVFQQGKFAELINLVTSVHVIFLELLHHSDEGAHVFGASLFEILNDLLRHDNFLFMLL